MSRQLVITYYADRDMLGCGVRIAALAARRQFWEEPARFHSRENDRDRLVDSLGAAIHDHVRRVRSLVRIRHTGEVVDLAGKCLHLRRRRRDVDGRHAPWRVRFGL